MTEYHGSTPTSRGAAERLYDLHVHTSNSDGNESPLDVARGAARAAAICITDHSGVTHSPALEHAAATAGSGLLFPGIEVSTMHQGRKYHVLGYGQGLLEQAVAHHLFHPTRVKNAVYAQVTKALRTSGVRLPDDAEMMLAAADASGVADTPGKWMMSKRVILAAARAAGSQVPVGTVEAMYEDAAQAHPSRYLDTVECLRKMREHGVLPSLAHPWWECASGRNSWSTVEEHLRTFRAAGLLAAEVSSRHDNIGSEAERRSVAADVSLLVSAGSDYHANGKTCIGQYGITAEELDHLIRQARTEGCHLQTGVRID